MATAFILSDILLLPSCAAVTPLSQFILAGWEVELEMHQFNEVLVFTEAEHRPKNDIRAALRFLCLSCFDFFESKTSFNLTPLINYQ